LWKCRGSCSQHSRNLNRPHEGDADRQNESNNRGRQGVPSQSEEWIRLGRTNNQETPIIKPLDKPGNQNASNATGSFCF
jgi:hypothetical protein